MSDAKGIAERPATARMLRLLQDVMLASAANDTAALNAYITEAAVLVETLEGALRYARDCIASPLRPFADGQDIYETPMMTKALRMADAALAGEATT